jgi:uncharacterized membrane protein
MSRKWETILLVVLPVLIMGFIIYNAGVMSRIYTLENGLDQDSKICQARILPDKYDVSALSGDDIQLNVEILNQGNYIWMRGGSNPVCLSYHILDGQKRMLVFDNARYELPNNLRPEDSVKINVDLLADLEPGDYVVEFDMVEEGSYWFAEKGSPTSLVKLHITK